MAYLIPINTTQSLRVEGHTEITLVFQQFVKEHPEARKYELRFYPAPWTETYAQPFKHIPNEWVPYLREIWLKQLNKLIAESESSRMSA